MGPMVLWRRQVVKISSISCNLWLSLYALSLGAAEIPNSAPVHEDSCMEGICERSHTLTEQFTDKYSAEQQNKDIPDQIGQEQMFDNIGTDAENAQSGCSFCQDGSNNQDNSHLSEESTDEEMFAEEHSARLEIVGFTKREINKRVETNPPVENVETEERGSPHSSEITEKNEHETEFPQLEVIGIDSVDVGKDNNDDNLRRESSEPHLEQPTPRRRYFPLLYTIRTLLNSLLLEFGDDSANQENPFNSSDIATGNSTTPEDLIKDVNTTTNGTDSGRKSRFQCVIKNTTSNATGEVKIVNSTELLEMLNFSKNQKVSPCVLVMFHAPWCHFCARAAPHYNALARAFPQLDILAVDTSHFSYLNARFGTVAVPNLMLFHARSAVRFNHTARVLENFVQFVTNNTGIEPDISVRLEPADFLGPLPSVVVRGRDWLLWLAWTFVIICSAYGFVRSHYGQSFITWLRVLWQEHQHIE